jgi:23S rRNA (adenine2503-C2)-methyltransferase
MKPHFFDFTPEQVTSQLQDAGVQAFRSSQIYRWVFTQGVTDFAQMTNLSQQLRDDLAQRYSLDLPQIIQQRTSTDGTRKFLLGLSDGATIEMVLIPAGEKHTLCVSSQVGCARNCQFCATATLGLKRNLKPHEILGQIYLAMQQLGEKRLTNLVFMGMGEPLDNYDNLLLAIGNLQHEKMFSFSPRRITVSTCGVVPKIRTLAHSGLKVKLAVSLNAAVPHKREQLMPITRQYSLDELKAALLEFRRKTSYRITFEYVLIKNFNMGPEDVKALRKFAGDISCKINMIPWNEVEHLPYTSPSEADVEQFRQELEKLSVAITLRKSRGGDIDAACGQLAGKYQQNNPQREE